MTRGFRFTAPKWKPVTDGLGDDMAKAAAAAADEITQGLKLELRAQVEAAGLGARVANTWQGRRYPSTAASINAAAYVWSKAPAIIDAFDRGPVIHTVNGRRYLAIPWPNVPRTAGARGGGGRMTPAQVETYFNQDLKFARAGNGRLVAYVDVVGTAAGSFKRATGKQLGRLYRQGKAPPHHVQVPMFTLTPTARMPKRLSVDQAAEHWAAQVPDILESKFEALG
ncbi:MAG TPA: DUF6441 family protein [Rhizomicrobium sp.]|jgi:hypothetical protein